MAIVWQTLCSGRVLLMIVSGRVLPNSAQRRSRNSSITPPLEGESERRRSLPSIRWGANAGAHERQRRKPVKRRNHLAVGVGP